MEYERTEDGQIQADFARRAGQILLQYEHCKAGLPDDQQFEATLAIALLQTMLTQCQELIKNRGVDRGLRGFDEFVAVATRGIDEQPPMMGIMPSCIVQRWPSEKPVQYRDVISCIRNALSHPLAQTEKHLPRTGYTTIRGASGFIEAFSFTQSPWVDPAGDLLPRYQATRKDTQKFENAAINIQRWSEKAQVENVVLRHAGNTYRPFRDNEPFVPVMRVRLDKSQLQLMVIKLSKYLSEPLRQ